jgi:sugar lactone lactonase YvrE
MYWVESMAKTIYAYDFDEKSGGISNKRVFYQHEGPGLPDGLTIDVEGNLWLALYGGAAVWKISALGQPLGKVDLPVPIVTCPTFGGPDMDELFITTAGADHQGDIGSEGLEGSVFRAKVGVKGLPSNKFVLSA